jgi:hypothetical protein
MGFLQGDHRRFVAARPVTPAARRVLSLVIVLVGALAVPAAAEAETTLAVEQAPTAVNAFRGRVVWSSFDPASGRYYLKVLRRGRVRKLGIRARKAPFDVDLGPDAHGRVVAVYSRCRTEPPAGYSGTGSLAVYEWGRGCHIYSYRFDTGRERRLKIPVARGTTDYRPTIWGRTLVFVRIFTHRGGLRGAYPYLESVRLPAGTPRRLRGGTRGEYLARHEGGPGPVSLDLRGDQLAFGWLATLDQCPFEDQSDYPATLAELWLGRLGSRPKLIDHGCETYIGATDRPHSTISAHDVGFDAGELWYAQRRIDGSRFRGYTPATRAAESYPVSFIDLGLAVHRRTIYFTRFRCQDCDAVDVVRDRHFLRDSPPSSSRGTRRNRVGRASADWVYGPVDRG